jgi:CRP/FNR family transcriptional regulator
MVVSSLLTEGGEEITLHTGGTGTFIGVMDWLLERPTFSCSAQALVETTLAYVRPAALLKAVTMEPGLLATLLKQFGSQMHSIEHQFAAGQSRDAGGRILRCLLDLARNLGVTDQRGVSLPAEVTRTRLAQLTGLARETVSRSVRKLARAGLILHDGRRIVIPCVKRAEQALRRDRHH